MLYAIMVVRQSPSKILCPQYDATLVLALKCEEREHTVIVRYLTTIANILPKTSQDCVEMYLPRPRGCVFIL